MNISSFYQRGSIFVPSMKCQSLLGKALQEHFTKPDQIASVFSSSPSLQNSSAGANFLTNFRIDDKSRKLFETVFTPEDCFALQFAFSLSIESPSRQLWTKMFCFFRNLINLTKYLEASLRSLKIRAQFITDEQLHFILSNLRRLTKIVLDLDENRQITSSAISSIGSEHLRNLEELQIKNSQVVTTPVLEVFASKLNKLTTLVFENCDSIDDESFVEISKIINLTSFSMTDSERVSSVGFGHIALSMRNLHELTLDHSSHFSNDVLQDICSNCLLLKKLHVENCEVSDSGLSNLKLLSNCCESLNLSWNEISAAGVNEICSLKNLRLLDLSHCQQLSDSDVGKICSSLRLLRSLRLACCIALSSKTLDHLKKLLFVEELDLREIHRFSMLAIVSLLQATKSTLRRFVCSGVCACVWNVFSSSRVLELTFPTITDADVAILLEALGNERCHEVEEIDISKTSITEISVALISSKMKKLRKISFDSCSKIKFENLKVENNNNNNSPNEAITELDLSNTNVDDDGIAKIVSAFPQLRILKLFSVFVTAVSLNLIADRYSNLAKITVQSCGKISSSDIKKLKAQLLNCEVVDDDYFLV